MEDKKPFRWNHKYFTILIYALIFVAGSILIYKFIGNFDTTLHMLGSLFSMLSPFILGAFIAFILYPVVRFFYDTCFCKLLKMKSGKLSKGLSLFLTYVLAIGIITILLVFIIPQIYDSISELTARLPEWYESALEFITNFEQNHPNWSFIDYDLINSKIESALPMIVNYLSNIMSSVLPVIFTTSMAIVKGIFNFVIAIIVSVYMISDHKNLFFQSKRFLYAFVPQTAAKKMRTIIHESAKIFSSFIVGKAIDSLIICIICFIAMLIFRFPYALLISVTVGITNMIPYFGPYLGGAIGGLIILIVNPMQVIFFAILVLVIQQFDGLFLGPKILGESTGLKPLWVIFSITIGGSLAGILGMFLGVPVFAVIVYIINLIVTHFLEKKKIAIESIDEPNTDKPE